MQLARLIDYHAENVILKELVFFPRGYSTRVVLVVDRFRLRSWRVAEIERPEIGRLKLDRHAAMLLVIRHRTANKVLVTG